MQSGRPAKEKRHHYSAYDLSVKFVLSLSWQMVAFLSEETASQTTRQCDSFIAAQLHGCRSGSQERRGRICSAPPSAGPSQSIGSLPLAPGDLHTIQDKTRQDMSKSKESTTCVLSNISPQYTCVLSLDHVARGGGVVQRSAEKGTCWRKMGMGMHHHAQWFEIPSALILPAW